MSATIRTIDLNADLGEHPDSDLDEQIMPYISSCNIACGGHVGNETTVRKTVRLALKHEVAIGAHPSYPDKENFGRKVMLIQLGDLAASIKDQIEIVQRICEEEGASLHHIKPHGALYNQAAKDPFISELILKVIEEVCPNTLWMGLANSSSERVAKRRGYTFISEGFADRQYESDGTLRSRTLDGAVLKLADVLKQVDELVINHRVKAQEWLPLEIQSICLHSDTEGAVTLAKEINQHLVSKGVRIAAV
ncbi:UPF0271 protein [Ekhidna lutea]|uniref:UPF0271 protein n=1 Tax=Ekhidna lutea TaxID=447679 RepID=A0A239EY50_EKHLU|nr:5-oxoprolinase subunit PxpA [Ekhidna lutea]SNS49517.1 UPF0271 protein [Ekhidna lutea]